MKGIPGLITDEGKYVENQVIPCYQTDGAKRLKPSGFMDIAQEMAFRAAQSMGFGYDQLLLEGKAWVLYRFHFRCIKVPRWREEVQVSTWNRGPFGPLYYRDFRLEGENSEILATSSWIVLDVAGRRVCRSAEALSAIPEKYRCDEAVLEEPAPKIVIPANLQEEFVGMHRVGYADIDMLGHTNNARYMAWATECVDFGDAEGLEPADVFINFIHETKAGDEVSLYRARDGRTYYVEGRVGDEVSFTVRIDFK